MKNTIKIESVGAYINLLNLTQDYLGKTPLYRGEAMLYDLPCEPKAFRKESSYRHSQPMHLLDPIAMSVQEWKTDVMLAEGRPLNTSSQLEDMILAQHYGIATRLLDWSTNPLVALWFATTYENKDVGFVYLFDAESDYLDIAGESYRQTEDQSDRHNALHKNPFNYAGNRRFYIDYSEFKETHFFRPKYLPDARVLAQSGVISIHPKPDSFDLNELSKTFEIPANSKHQIKVELDKLGINFRTMGLATRESLAQTINSSQTY